MGTLFKIGNVEKSAILALAPQIPIKIEVHVYPLIKANKGLNDLHQGNFTSAAVIKIS